MTQPDSQFVAHQAKALQALVKHVQGSTLGENMGLGQLSPQNAKQLEIDFQRLIPLQTASQWANWVTHLVHTPKLLWHDVLEKKKYLSTDKLVGMGSLVGHGLLPVSHDVAKAYWGAEYTLVKKYIAHGTLKKGHVVRLPQMVTDRTGQPHGATRQSSNSFGYCVQKDPGKVLFSPWKHITPRGHLFGRSSQAQMDAQMIRWMRSHGSDVRILIASPRQLIDLAYMLACYHKRLVKLTDLMPKLKLVMLTSPFDAPYTTELDLLLPPSVKRSVFLADSAGALLYTADPNAPNVLQFHPQAAAYYTFVQTIEGTQKRSSAAQVRKGETYTLFASTSAGVMGVQTPWQVKVLSTSPFRVRVVNTTETVGALALSEFFCSHLMDVMETRLGGQGLFVRDYCVGYDAHKRAYHWAIELSRPLSAAAPKALQEFATQLHKTLEQQHLRYAQAIESGELQPSVVHVVPLGTFNHLPDAIGPHWADRSSNQQRLALIKYQAPEVRTVTADL